MNYRQRDKLKDHVFTVCVILGVLVGMRLVVISARWVQSSPAKEIVHPDITYVGTIAIKPPEPPPEDVQCPATLSLGWNSLTIMSQEALGDFGNLVTEDHAILVILPDDYQGDPEQLRLLIIAVMHEENTRYDDD